MSRPTPSPEAPSFDRFSVLAGVVVLGLVGYFGWRYFDAPSSQTPETPAVMAPAENNPTPVAEAPAAPAAAEPEAPGIQHPIEPLEAAEAPAEPEPLPALSDSDAVLTQRLSQLLGRKNVLAFLQLDGFVQRTVATVDNLARPQASTTRWPVVPTPQRFTTLRNADGVETIHPDNSRRYAPFVALVASVDAAQAAALYRGLYPLFQQAYEELGFPGRYFNDRLVEVLDHLIATPVPNAPLTVSLVEVKGTVASLRPWVRYELADPTLESMSAGRKILLRVGPENQRRLQAKLAELRELVAKP